MFSVIGNTLRHEFSGTPCTKDGEDLPPGAPPPPWRTACAPGDEYSPFLNRPEFEIADFLFKRAQMSQAHVDELMQLWAAFSLLQGGSGSPPFTSVEEMHNLIDSIPFGDALWKSFSISYTGDKPPNPPDWMEKQHECWFRDPRTLLHQILANPDFNGECDYTAYMEFDKNGKRRYKDFYSGNWVWELSVCPPSQFCSATYSMFNRRCLLPRIPHWLGAQL